MKIIDTHLTEQNFLERLSCYCREQTRGDKGYRDQDTFIFARKKQKFWIGRHYAHAGRSDGYANERINGTYHVNDHGHVVVSYNVGKHPAILVPHIVFFLLGMVPVVGLLNDAMRQSSMSWYGGVCGLAFVGLGLSGFFNRRKEVDALEEHLLYICDALKETDLDVTAEADTFDVSDISDGDVYPISVEFEGENYLTLYYYTAEENGDGVLNDGKNIVYFKDEAQMNRFCLFHKLTVADDVDGGIGIDQADDVKVDIQILGVDLDDILCAHFTRMCIGDQCNGTIQIVQLQEIVDLHALAGFDVVDDDAVLNGINIHYSISKSLRISAIRMYLPQSA